MQRLKTMIKPSVASIQENIPAYAARGAVKVVLGHVSEANRGFTKEAQRHYYAAIEDFDRAIGLNREDAYAYTIRGYARMSLR